MQFNIGDYVVHPAFGRGHIVKIEERLSDIETRPYYKIVRPQHTMWLRVGAEEITGLRLVTAKPDISPEWATAADVSATEANGEIDPLLQATRSAFTA